MTKTSAPGETNLDKLRSGLSPQLQPGTFVYCMFPDFRLPDGLRASCTVVEAEGLTAILALDDALKLGCSYTFESRLITLRVHSALDAVGLLACVTSALARAGIPCNAVGGYHHDHLYVPVEDADAAMAILHVLANGSGATIAV